MFLDPIAEGFFVCVVMYSSTRGQWTLDIIQSTCSRLKCSRQIDQEEEQWGTVAFTLR
jgi:hypothetical protein